MFSKELKRRGLDSIDDLGGWPSAADEGKQQATAVVGLYCWLALHQRRNPMKQRVVATVN